MVMSQICSLIQQLTYSILSTHTVAIVVPYRDRPQHLPVFLHHMHFFLQRQELDYTIFIVEQTRKWEAYNFQLYRYSSASFYIRIKKTHQVLTAQC